MITFFHFFSFFRCIFDSNNFHPQGNYHELFESLDQNKPAITCSRADHVGFKTDSVTSNSDSVSKILNCDKVVNKSREKSQSLRKVANSLNMNTGWIHFKSSHPVFVRA